MQKHHVYKTHYVTLFMVIVLLPAFYGCLRGPSFLGGNKKSRNSRSPIENVVTTTETSSTVHRVIVPTTVEGSRAKATIEGNSQNTQVVQASANSKIAGAQVEFPPGTVSISTEIAIQPGQAVATEQTLQSLAIDAKVASRAPSLVVTSTVALDTTAPFSVTLPVPSAGLTLATEFPQFGMNDPLGYLVVFYNVFIAAENRYVAGVIPRKEIEMVNGYARIMTRHFGTFQTALMTKPLETAAQVAAAPLPPPPVAANGETISMSKRYYIDGAATTSVGAVSDFRSWFASVSPMMVGTSSTMVVGVRSYPGPE